MSFARPPLSPQTVPPRPPAAHVSASAGACIHELFAVHARRTPHAIAVRCGARTLTYRELDARADRLAAELQALGVGPEVLVGLCAHRSLEAIVGLVAVLKAGGAYLALDPEYPDGRVAWMLRHARPRVLLTQSALRDRVMALASPPGQLDTPLAPAVLCLDAPDSGAPFDRCQSSPARTDGARPTAESLAYVAFTSGSSGEPKGVEILHRGVTRLVHGADYATFGPEEVFLHLAPLAFDASTFEIWGALLNGGTLAVMPPGPPSLEEVGRAIREHRVTTLWLTAGLFHAMVEHRLDDLRPLRQLLAGGDVLSPQAVRRVREVMPACRMINGYGPTECTTFACCHTVDTLPLDRSVPIGRPIARTRAHLLDERLEPVPTGAIGELHLGGDGLARGYLNDPALTAEKFIPDPFIPRTGAKLYRTGDLARLLPDGNFEFVGRRDRQIKIRGFRVEPGEIEAALATHPDIQDAVVSAIREAATGGNTLVAYLVPRRVHAPSAGALRSFLGDQLPDYMVPSLVVPLAQLPLTPCGKIDRHALPDPRAGASQNPPALALPASTVELRLQRIWEQVLEVRCGLLDNFFDLGGHSLRAFHLISEINRAWQCDLRVTALWQNPTIAQLATVLRDLPRVTADGTIFPLHRSRGMPGAPLYFIQLDAGNFHLAQLANLVDGNQPTFATDVPFSPEVLAAAAARDATRLPSLEEIAAPHTALILQNQPSGPCRLAGYCYTSILAWEVAAQLARHGRTVETLFLVNPPIEHLGRWRRTRLRLRARLHHWQLTFGLAWSKANSPLPLVLAQVVSRRGRRAGSPTPNGITCAALPPLFTLLDRIQVNAVHRYRTRSVAARAVVLNCRATLPTFHAANRLAPIERHFAGGMEVSETPGDHWSLVQPPHLETLARHFNRALAQARAAQMLHANTVTTRSGL